MQPLSCNNSSAASPSTHTQDHLQKPQPATPGVNSLSGSSGRRISALLEPNQGIHRPGIITESEDRHSGAPALQLQAQGGGVPAITSNQLLCLSQQPPSLPPQHQAQGAGGQAVQQDGQVLPKFPSTSSRQRSSNVNLTDPELEFLKTALSSCRSNISQQEAEIKRLHESIDIRNKRIAQLEIQIGHASDYVSARPTQANISEDRMEHLFEKLENISKNFQRIGNSTPSNNITINSCHSSRTQPQQDNSTQTDPPSSSSNTSEERSEEECNLIQAQTAL